MLLFCLEFYYFIIKIKSECLARNMKTISHPNMNTLDNDRKLLIASNGITIYNKDMTIIYFHYNFPPNITIEDNDDIAKTNMKQFSEDNGEKYIICLIENYFLILDENGELYFNIFLSINPKNAISLIPYKYENSKYYFIIAYSDGGINFFYYNFEIISKNNLIISLIITTIYKPEIDNNKGLACEILKSNDSIKSLTCFVTIRYVNLFASNTFNPDENFTLILNPANISVDRKDIKYISSASDKNKENILVCYSSPAEYIECLIYNINDNNFINKDYKIQPCSARSGAIHTYYFPKNNQFVASCISNNKDYSLLIINEDFSNSTLSTERLGYDCYGIYSFSIIPSISEGEYSILLHSNCDSGTYIRQYIITEKEENCIEYREEPIDLSSSTEFISTSIKEIFSTTEPTILMITDDISVEEEDKCTLQKCSKCDNESINQNKCISCNNKENYYSIKSEFISQKNRIFEYIDCYNEYTKPNNYCLNKDYYEKCFESCYILYNCSSRIFLDFNNFKNNNNDNYTDYIFQNCNDNLLYNIDNKTNISNINEKFNMGNNSCLEIAEKKVCIINCSDDNEINKRCYESLPYETYNSSLNIFLCIKNPYKIYEDIDSFYSFLQNNENSKDNLFESIRNELINGNLNLLIDNIIKKDKKNIIYKDDNLIYELSSTDIKNHDNNISSINLGICENKLKIENDININVPLLILKIDINEKGMLIPIIEYEIYDFETKKS